MYFKNFINKSLMSYLLLLVPFLLSAEEFKFIQPVSVEEAPFKKVVKKQKQKQKLTQKQEEKKAQTQKSETKQTTKEPDSDGDGVVDTKDKCPNTSKDFIVDYQGCPKTATLKINFESSKYNISDNLIQDLKTFADFLQENKSYQVVIYGYTDNSGDERKNKILSQKRADTVKKALESYGINSTRLTAVGMGDKDPIADNTDPEGRAKNRRIEVELIY